MRMADTTSGPRAQIIFDPAELKYNFGAHHPLQPARIIALVDLLEKSGLWHSDNEATRLPLRPATVEELGLVHTPDYIAAVQLLSKSDEKRLEASETPPQESGEKVRLALKYGFGDGDTPVLPRMHEVSADIAGGSLVALSAVMGLSQGGTSNTESERPLHVFHPAGGLHHAWAERASGFCIYRWSPSCLGRTCFWLLYIQ